MPAVQVSYYSDVLCIWAYAAERRLQELVEAFGDQISIDNRYCSVFPDAWGKIEAKWVAKGGYGGFNRHLMEVAQQFPHIEVNERVWLDTRPRTSASAHLFLKAIEAIEHDQHGDEPKALPYTERTSVRAAWALRHAFFALARDISNWQVHKEIAEQLGIDYALVQTKIQSSEAVALLAVDYNLSQTHHVTGSPTFIMNNGRQKLFGNVGYRLLEANVHELLRNPSSEEASWC
jgi:predicted DsbA family dithiol-disulfide isomerase